MRDQGPRRHAADAGAGRLRPGGGAERRRRARRRPSTSRRATASRASALAGGRRDHRPSPGRPASPPRAIAADPEHGRIYIGTSYPELADDVIAIDPATGIVETYERGFAGVTGLGVDGRRHAAGRPTIPASPPATSTPSTRGACSRVRHHELRRAAVSITAAPPLWSSRVLRHLRLRVLRARDVRVPLERRRVDAVRRLRLGQRHLRRTSTRARTPSRSARPRRGSPGVAARRVFVIDRTAPDRDRHLARRRVRARPRPRAGSTWSPTSSARPSPARSTAATPRRASPGRRCRSSRPARTPWPIVAEDAAGNRSDGRHVRFTVARPRRVGAGPGRPRRPAPETPRRPPAPAGPAARRAAPLVPRGDVAGVAAARALRASPRCRLRTQPRARRADGPAAARARRRPGRPGRPRHRPLARAASSVATRTCASAPARACASTSASPARRAGGCAAGRYAVTRPPGRRRRPARQRPQPGPAGDARLIHGLAGSGPQRRRTWGGRGDSLAGFGPSVAAPGGSWRPICERRLVGSPRPGGRGDRVAGSGSHAVAAPGGERRRSHGGRA